MALALWRLADPGNVGTLIRTADAFGAAVALSDGCADPLQPKALRASAGSIWRVPLGTWAELDADLEPGRARPAREGRLSQEAELTDGVAFLLGAERAGLPSEVERDAEARIPVDGVDSLNVAVSGAIALYEWRRRAG